VTDWSGVFLGIIAVSVVIMAVVQVGVVIGGALLARRVSRLATQIEDEVRPLSAHVRTIAVEASRASTLAAQQVERADRVFADLSVRIEETAAILQNAVVTPARESIAVVAGVKAALASLRGLRDTAVRPRHVRGEDDEESLFIG
jgi:hypothetical protein